MGRWLTDSLWEKIRVDTVDGNGYRKGQSLKHLEPWERYVPKLLAYSIYQLM